MAKMLTAAVIPDWDDDVLTRYLQQMLAIRAQVRQIAPPPTTVAQIFATALAALPEQATPRIVTVRVPQTTAYWCHTSCRAYLVLAGMDEQCYCQGLLLLGYHLLVTLAPDALALPAICAPFDTDLWRSPRFCWPRCFSHCLTADLQRQSLV